MGIISLLYRQVLNKPESLSLTAKAAKILVKPLFSYFL